MPQFDRLNGASRELLVWLAVEEPEGGQILFELQHITPVRHALLEAAPSGQRAKHQQHRLVINAKQLPTLADHGAGRGQCGKGAAEGGAERLLALLKLGSRSRECAQPALPG